MDIGVDYDERSAHVKQVIMDVARSARWWRKTPSEGPSEELADFSKNYRLYAWISDYSEEPWQPTGYSEK